MDWYDVFVIWYCKHPTERVDHSLDNLVWFNLILNIRYYLQIYSYDLIWLFFSLFFVVFWGFSFFFFFFFFLFAKWLTLWARKYFAILFWSLFDWINCAESLSTDISNSYGVWYKQVPNSIIYIFSSFIQLKCSFWTCF